MSDEIKTLLAEALAPFTARFDAIEAALPAKSAGFAVAPAKTPAETKDPGPLYTRLGEFLMDVAKSERGPSNRKMEELKSADPLDENGYNVAKAMGDKFVGSIFAATKAPAGLHEGLGSTGAFLVGTDSNLNLMERVYNTSQLLSRIAMDPVSATSNGATYNAEDETSRANGSRRGGIQAYWQGEAGAFTSSKPKFRQMELKLKKVTGLCYATDEQMNDAPNLESYIMRVLPEELRFKVEDSIINGSGAGQPLGILNCGALVSVTKELAQGADTIVAENIMNMFSRMWAPSLSRAVWYIGQDCWPQLFSMALSVGTGGVPVFMPPTTGLAGAPFGTLMGRPIVVTEYNDTVGDQGDIIFADLGQYQGIEKGGVQSASSIHVNFTTGETCFRFVLRMDGQPMWNSALTPKNSTNTVSPFVALDARA